MLKDIKTGFGFTLGVAIGIAVTNVIVETVKQINGGSEVNTEENTETSK